MLKTDGPVHTHEPFPQALRELVAGTESTTQTGNVNWSAFAENVDMHYETLRKALAGERMVTQRIIVKCAEALAIDPTYFAEYRLEEYRRRLDTRVVGLTVAVVNLQRL